MSRPTQYHFFTCRLLRRVELAGKRTARGHAPSLCRECSGVCYRLRSAGRGARVRNRVEDRAEAVRRQPFRLVTSAAERLHAIKARNILVKDAFLCTNTALGSRCLGAPRPAVRRCRQFARDLREAPRTAEPQRSFRSLRTAHHQLSESACDTSFWQGWTKSGSFAKQPPTKRPTSGTERVIPGVMPRCHDGSLKTTLWPVPAPQ